jgi:hypothetical protein
MYSFQQSNSWKVNLPKSGGITQKKEKDVDTAESFNAFIACSPSLKKSMILSNMALTVVLFYGII